MRKYGKNKGFTLIELLVVIVIIGLLAGLLLITVRGVILRGRDARIIAAMSQIRTQAEIYFDTNNSFDGLSRNTVIGNINNEVSANQSTPPTNSRGLRWGLVNDVNYTVWAYLNTGGSFAQAYCIDSDGYACRLSDEAANNLTVNSSSSCGCPGERTSGGGGGFGGNGGNGGGGGNGM